MTGAVAGGMDERVPGARVAFGTTAASGATVASGATAPPGWDITTESPGSAVARALWRDYYTEVSNRWYLRTEGRCTDPAELEREIAADTGDGLEPPSGRLLVARYDGEPAGMAGVRLLVAAGRTAELKRVYLRAAHRGRGGAALLVRAAEAAAREMGARRVVLDTRDDLVEARALYTRLGYAETPPHNAEPYAEHWYGKAV